MDTAGSLLQRYRETGMRVEPTALLGVYSDPGYIVAYDDHEDPSRYGEVRQEFEITLIGRPIDGAPTTSDEADSVRWFTPSELENLDIHPRSPQCVRRARRPVHS